MPYQASANQIMSGHSAFGDLFASSNQFNHNEALYAYQREMDASNTAMQRSVKDYEAAGFSPLAALGGGGASTPSSAAASASGSSGKGPGMMLQALATFGSLIGASVGSAAKMASASAAGEKSLASLIKAQAYSSRVSPFSAASASQHAISDRYAAEILKKTFGRKVLGFKK